MPSALSNIVGGLPVPAVDISVEDTNGDYTATDVEGVLAEIAPQLGGGSGESFQRDIAQAAHGLAVGNVVRHNGTSYVKAQANSAANAEVVGIVAAVADVNNFTLHYGGRITGLSALTAGNVYYLDDDTSGLLTATEPPDAGDVSKPLLMADSTTSGYFFNYRGALNVDMATQAELDAHVNDTSDAHDASAISVLDTAGDYTATDVEGVLAEIAPQLGGGVAAIVQLHDEILGTSTASFDVSSISQDYNQLRVVIVGRSTRAGQFFDNPRLRMNNDSGNNYDWDLVQPEGNAGAAGESSIRVHHCTAESSPANNFARMVIDISSYTDAFEKDITYQNSVRLDTSDHRTAIGAGHWRSTSAINRITVFPENGSWLTGSRITIYGID
jgi:hypothetical protein